MENKDVNNLNNAPANNPSKILLDTNFLISVFELKLDLLSLIDKEFGKGRYFTLNLVKEEIKRLANLEVKDSTQKNAKMALKLLENIPIENFEKGESVDDALVEYCVANNCILATMDAELKKKAKHKHLKILGIRQKKYLIFES